MSTSARHWLRFRCRPSTKLSIKGGRLGRRQQTTCTKIPNLGSAWSFSATGFAISIAALCIYDRLDERHHLQMEHDYSLRTRRLIDGAEVKRHNTAESCWVVVNGAVWDMTDFLAAHPGGMDAVLRVAGTDASKVFNPIHPSDTLKDGLQPQNCLGDLDPNGEAVEVSVPISKSVAAVDSEDILPLASIVDLDDFEAMAKLGLSGKAWSYYASTADDGKTYIKNRTSWSEVLLRPRILVDVTNVDFSGQILGNKSNLPIYISPAALAKLAHDDGEVALCRGAQKAGIIQCISNNASCSLNEIHDAASADQALFLQLYVSRDGERTDALLKRLHTMEKIKALYLTVDAPVGGKRVLDEKYKASQIVASGGEAVSTSTSTVMFSGVSPALTWDYVKKLKTDLPQGMPIMIKGVSTVEDAIMAHKAGATGIVLSNHGGRQLDTTPAPLLTLLEIRKHAPWLIKDDKGNGLEIHIDGGIRRGTDVLKALALGATACGLGRPFLYSLANDYGEDGVVKVVDILKNEMEIGMRLLGVTNLAELRKYGSRFVNTKALDPLIPDADLSEWPELAHFK